MNSRDNLENLPKSVGEARELGSKHYFTGKPCKRGHVDIRLTSTRSCLSCNSEDQNNRRKENPEIHIERCRVWRENNRDKSRLSAKKWADNNREYVRECRRVYGINNREALSKKEREYKEKNRDKYRLYQTKRKIRERDVTPKWVDQEEIEYIYKLASEKGLVVDHIVPLNSKYVCGLHTGDNLRCIPSKLNSYKGNRYWPDMPENFPCRRY